VPFDLIVNTGSLAEMTEDWVRHWGNWLNEQKSQLFYSHNLIGNPVDAVHETPATMAPIVSSTWRPIYVRPMHPMMVLQSKARLASEIIFERMDHSTESDVAAVLAFFEGTKLRLDNYIYILYAILRDMDANRRHITRFSRKVMHDFGYPTSELLYLLKHAEMNDEEMISLYDNLQQRSESKYKENRPDKETGILALYGYERARKKSVLEQRFMRVLKSRFLSRQ
jgi:hypothetical protein